MKRLLIVLIVSLLTLQTNGQIAKDYYEQGNSKLNLEEYTEAINAYSKAITLYPNYAEAYCFRGRAKGKQENYKGAIDDCSVAIKLKPNFAEAYYNRGWNKYYMKDYQGAILDFNRVLDIDNRHAKAYYWKGCSLEMMKDYNAAIEVYSKAISLGVELAENYYLRGHARIFNGDLVSEVKEDLDKSIMLNQDNGRAYLLRGIVSIELKNYTSALEDFVKVSNLDTSLVIYCIQQKAYAEYNLKMYPEAIKDYSIHLASNPQNEESYRIRGCAYFDLGDYAKAVIDFNSALQYGNNTVLYYLKGYAEHSLKDYENAYHDYSKALEFTPNDFLVYSNRGRLLIDIGYFNDGILDLNKAISINQNDFLVYYNRGVAKNALGDIVGANSDFNKAIEINPNYADSYNNRGYMKYLLGYYGEAIIDFDKAISIDSNHKFALANRQAAKNAKKQQISQAFMSFGNALQQLGNTITQQSIANKPINQSGEYPSPSIKSKGGLKQIVCPYCKGSRVQETPSYGPSYGLDRSSDERCKVCGKFENHYHANCIPCQGKGYIEKYVP